MWDSYVHAHTHARICSCTLMHSLMCMTLYLALVKQANLSHTLKQLCSLFVVLFVINNPTKTFSTFLQGFSKHNNRVFMLSIQSLAHTFLRLVFDFCKFA